MQNDYGLYELIRQALEEQRIFKYWTELEPGVFSIAQYPENVNHSFVHFRSKYIGTPFLLDKSAASAIFVTLTACCDVTMYSLFPSMASRKL